MSSSLTDGDWETILGRIRDGQCTPFLGAGVCHGSIPLGAEIARSWASEFGYPLDDCADLARVAQFMAVSYEGGLPRERMRRLVKSATSPDYTDPNEPHRVLAELPLPVYITTNYDAFMTDALKLVGNKTPHRELCRWNDNLEDCPTVLQPTSTFEPSVSDPIVFHLHGHADVTDSILISENDYVDFIVRLSRGADLIPHWVQRAFSGSSIVFLGYRLADWNFRVIYRSLVSYLSGLKKVHISVQLVPGDGELSEERRAQVQAYLNNYFREIQVKIYWGTAQAFAVELKQRWEAFPK